MLTGKIGNEIINCYDGTHSREQLKKWTKKKIILCPVCNKPYEYCHGRVKMPYFRHMDKVECEDKYSESETEEHLCGKLDLYEWIKKQKNVKNVVLEGWIPETKQRPDIMFEFNSEKYVIEFQCSPISSEYFERHELYQASGIHDIWICGTEKYLQNNMREKFLQSQAIGFYDYKKKNFIPLYENHLFYMTTLKKDNYHYKRHNFYGLNLNDFVFNRNIYNIHLGDPDEIYLKRKYRNELDREYYPREKDKYLNMQNDRIFSTLQSNLSKLSNQSNGNWNFYIMVRKNRYNSFKYIVAVPEIQFESDTYWFKENFLYKNFLKISLNKMDYDTYKKCKDINYLKQLLLPLMIENVNKLINYKSDYIRFVEVG